MKPTITIETITGEAFETAAPLIEKLLTELGEEGDDTTISAVGGTMVELDITKDIELTFDYRALVSTENIKDAYHHAEVILSYDLIGNLELDTTLVWDRVESPRPDSNGETPKRNDLRLVLGLSLDF